MPAAPAAPPTALSIVTKEALTRFTGSYDSAQEITSRIGWALQNCNLAAPATEFSSLPEGFSASLSVIPIDPQEDLYSVGGGKMALHATALSRIATGFGLSADPVLSGRMDDGRDPRYCHYRWVGHYRAMDGSVMTVAGEAKHDLRDGSPEVLELERTAAKKGRGGAEDQLSQMRSKILERTETRARNRAIAAAGIRRHGSAAQMARPFAVVRLVATGRTEDPELRREFARARFNAAIAGTAALYGRPMAPALTMATPNPEAAKEPAPPVGSVPPDVDDVPEDGPGDHDAGYDGPPEDAAPATGIPPRPETSALVLPATKKGTVPGLAVARTETAFLKWWMAALAKTVEDPSKDDVRRRDAATLLDAVEAELKWREATGQDKVPSEAKS